LGLKLAKLADIANQKIDRADIGPINCVTWEALTKWGLQADKKRKKILFLAVKKLRELLFVVWSITPISPCKRI
jgi:hypothetical protein